MNAKKCKQNGERGGKNEALNKPGRYHAQAAKEKEQIRNNQYQINARKERIIIAICNPG
jgi:hypothetical protein